MPTVDLGRVKGDPGTAATVRVGTVRTGAAGSNASVANRGTSQDAILDFVIPRGDNGQGEIPDDSISDKTYVIGVADGKMYMQDNAATPNEKRIMTLSPAHTWTVTT